MISLECKQHRNLPMGSIVIDRINKSRRISQSDLQKVKRVLFGPVCQESNNNFANTELQRQMTFNSTKWNFDFRSEKTLDPKGIYIWTAEIKTQQVRPKRKYDDEGFYDNSNLYFDADSMCKKNKDVKEKQEEKPTKVAEQRLMTDYLLVRKHSTPETTKKANSVPLKKPRLTTS